MAAIKYLFPILFAIMLFLSSCDSSKKEPEKVDKEHVSDFIYMELDENSISRTGVNIKLVNKTYNNLWIGRPFYLSDQYGEKVRTNSSTPEIVFPADATLINPQSIVTFYQSWSDIYGILSPGEYTFTKQYSCDDLSIPSKLLNCSFTISDDTPNSYAQENDFLILDSQSLLSEPQ